MSTRDEYLARLDAVEARLGAAAAAEPHPDALTGADPTSGERWDRGQVWAHVAEFIPYWIRQARPVIARAALRRACAVRAHQERSRAHRGHRARPARSGVHALGIDEGGHRSTANVLERAGTGPVAHCRTASDPRPDADAGDHRRVPGRSPRAARGSAGEPRNETGLRPPTPHRIEGARITAPAWMSCRTTEMEAQGAAQRGSVEHGSCRGAEERPWLE